MNIFSLAFIALLVLKLCGVINASWLLVCTPLIFWAVIIAIPFSILCVLILIYGVKKI